VIVRERACPLTVLAPPATLSVMSKPRLPSRPADTWEGGFLFDQPRLVLAVSAGGGLVIAGGPDLYLLRPGAQGMLTRPATEAFGSITVAATEPRAPRRYAVASDEMITIFYQRGGEDQLLRLRLDAGPRW